MATYRPNTDSDSRNRLWYACEGTAVAGGLAGGLYNFSFDGSTNGWLARGVCPWALVLSGSGTGQWVRIPPMRLSDNGPYTVEAWVVPNQGATGGRCIYHEGNLDAAPYNHRMQLRLINGVAQHLMYNDAGAYAQVTVGRGLQDGLLHHVAARADLNTMDVYADGVFSSGASRPALPITTTESTLGAYYTTASAQPFAGALVCLRLYNRRLGDEELLEHRRLGPYSDDYSRDRLVVCFRADRSLADWPSLPQVSEAVAGLALTPGDVAVVNGRAWTASRPLPPLPSGADTGLTIAVAATPAACPPGVDLKLLDAEDAAGVGRLEVWSDPIEDASGGHTGTDIGAGRLCVRYTTAAGASTTMVGSDAVPIPVDGRPHSIVVLFHGNPEKGGWTHVMAGYVDGVQACTAILPTTDVPSFVRLRLGDERSGRPGWLGEVHALYVWPRHLTDGELAALAREPLALPAYDERPLSGRLTVKARTQSAELVVPAEDLLPGLELATAAPGGYASASFGLRPLPAVGHAGPYSDTVVRDAAVTVTRLARGVERTLFEGVVANDPSRPRLSAGSLSYEVECTGPTALLSRRDDYCRTWVDDDLTQWEQSPSASQDYQYETDGELVIRARKGQAYRGNCWCSAYYWLDRGLGPGDSIDHLELRIGSQGVSLPLSGTWRFRVQAASAPYATRTTVLQWTSINDVPGGGAPGTTVRVPASGALPAGTRCLWLAFGTTNDATPTRDRWVSVDRAVVYRSAAAVRVDEALADVVAGVASAVQASAVGDARTDLVVRPVTTRADALAQICALHAEPVWWRWRPGLVLAVSAYPDPQTAGWLVVDPTEPGVDVELELAPEAAPAYCRVLYTSKGVVQGQQPVVPAGYEASLTVDAAGPVTGELAATARVAVLDLREGGRSLYPSEAIAVGRRYLAWLGAAQVEGTVTVRAREVARSDDTTVLPCEVEAGTWCLVEGYLGSPALVTEARYSAADDSLTLTLGVPRGDWSPDEPYPTARAEAARFDPATKGRYHGRRRRR